MKKSLVAGLALVVLIGGLSYQLIDKPLLLPPTPTPNQVADLQVRVYSASWCGPCQLLKKELDGANLDPWKVSRTEDEKEAAKQEVRLYPTLIAYKDGKEIGRRVGYAPAAAIRVWLDGLSH